MVAARAWLADAATAQELPKTHIEVVDNATDHYQYKGVEIRFFVSTAE